VRILVAEKLAPEGVALLAAEHQVDRRPGLPREELLRILPEYEALVVRSQVQVDAEAIAAGRRLVVIGRAGVGVDNVDVEAATQAGITVVNAPTGNTVAAAEHTMALLLAVARHVAEADASLRRGEWRRGELLGVELRGRTLGIVGLGRIGMAVAARARAFEMELIGSDPFVTAAAAAAHGIELVAFEDLLPRADAITLHLPLTEQTRGLIGGAALARMKPDAIVVNAARGGLVDESAVAAALHDGRLGGAGIDVFEEEPPRSSPLLRAPRTVLTPHLGASTAEAQALVAVEAAQQVLDVLAGRPARHAVNAAPVGSEPGRA
jgi:D-3-phosphoglycerate dehydrogenase